jgi:hypothetical protein
MEKDPQPCSNSGNIRSSGKIIASSVEEKVEKNISTSSIYLVLIKSHHD